MTRYLQFNCFLRKKKLKEKIDIIGQQASLRKQIEGIYS